MLDYPALIFLSHPSRLRAAEIALPLANALPACCTWSFDAPFLDATNAIFFEGNPATPILSVDLPDARGTARNFARWLEQKTLESFGPTLTTDLLLSRLKEDGGSFYDTVLIEDAYGRRSEVRWALSAVGRRKCRILNLDTDYFAANAEDGPRIIGYSLTDNLAADIQNLADSLKTSEEPSA